jgi:DNA repair exonuclease SbcCD ATPase subunit
MKNITTSFIFLILSFSLNSHRAIAGQSAEIGGDKKSSSTAKPKETTSSESSSDYDARMRAEERMRAEKKADYQKYDDANEAYRTCATGSKKDCSELKAKADKLKRELEFNHGKVTDSSDNEFCEQKLEEYNETYKECRSAYDTMSDKCNGKGEMEIVDSDTLNNASPFLNMLSGADTMLDIYSAMNDKPGCFLNKSDFMDEKRDLKDEVKDLQDKIKENTEKAQEAQEAFADKLKDWAEQEKEIADRLEEIPLEKDRKLGDLDKEKMKAKVEAESKYNAITDQILEMKRKYNELIDAQAVAMTDTSEFAIHDKCLNAIAKSEAEKNKNGAQQTATNSFKGAFLLGKNAQVYKQKTYDLCMSRERKNAVRVEKSFINELNSMKHKMNSYDIMLGQIQEEKKSIDADIAKQMQQLQASTDKEIKSLALKYQQIQQDKTNQQNLLTQKLKTLETDTKSLQQKVSVAKLKLQHFSNKTAPTNSDKSVTKLINECEDYPDFKEDFSSRCCNDTYQGKGKSLCKGFLKTTKKDKKDKKDTKKSK